MKKPFRFVFMAIATMLGGYLLITHVTETGISQEKEKNSKKREEKLEKENTKKIQNLSKKNDTKIPQNSKQESDL